jgi:hypothetical protein
VTKPSIALLGANGAGKTTIADYLVAEHGYRKLSFAEPLRELARLNKYWAHEEKVQGYDKAKQLMPWFRQYLINLGEGIRKYDPVYFVRALAQRITDMDPDKPWVVDDVRKQVEVNFLGDMGFRFLHVVKDVEIKDGGLDIPPLDVKLPTQHELLMTTSGQVWYRSQLRSLIRGAEWALGTPAEEEETDGSAPVDEQHSAEESGGGGADGGESEDTPHWCARCEREWSGKLDQLPSGLGEARSRWYASQGRCPRHDGEELGDAPEVRDGEGDAVGDHPSGTSRVVVNPSHWPGDVRPDRQ